MLSKPATGQRLSRIMPGLRRNPHQASFRSTIHMAPSSSLHCPQKTLYHPRRQGGTLLLALSLSLSSSLYTSDFQFTLTHINLGISRQSDPSVSYQLTASRLASLPYVMGVLSTPSHACACVRHNSAACFHGLGPRTFDSSSTMRRPSVFRECLGEMQACVSIFRSGTGWPVNADL